MQRIISMQMIRDSDRQSSEFVSKRLCCSFLFSIGFLSILGGFFLGRYATDRAIILKNAALQHKQQTEVNHTTDTLSNIKITVDHINNITKYIGYPVSEKFNYKEFYQILKCLNFTTDITEFKEEEFDRYFSLKVSKILHAHLNSLNDCFKDVGLYINSFIRRNVTRDGVRK